VIGTTQEINAELAAREHIHDLMRAGKLSSREAAALLELRSRLFRLALRRRFWRGFWDGFTLGPVRRWLRG
jgi:hypothetical protein